MKDKERLKDTTDFYNTDIDQILTAREQETFEEEAKDDQEFCRCVTCLRHASCIYRVLDTITRHLALLVLSIHDLFDRVDFGAACVTLALSWGGK